MTQNQATGNMNIERFEAVWGMIGWPALFSGMIAVGYREVPFSFEYV